MRPGGWRRVVAGAVVLLAVLAASAWYKQRFARQPETPKPTPVAAPSPRAGETVRPAPVAEKARNDTDSTRSPRGRPERERAGRP